MSKEGIKPSVVRYVLRRDFNTCQYCGDPTTDLDHVIPRSKGGTHNKDNLVVACRVCNSIASDKLFESFYHKKEFILRRKALTNSSTFACEGIEWCKKNQICYLSTVNFKEVGSERLRVPCWESQPLGDTDHSRERQRRIRPRISGL